MNKLIVLMVMCYQGICFANAQETEITGRLYSIPGIKSVEVCNDSVFGQYYRCFISQPYDHNHPENGYFSQQFCLFHRSDSAAVVFVTTGDRLDSLYQSEVATLLKANQVLLETRYCGKSIAGHPIDWNTLTMSQIAADIHSVITGLKTTLYSRNYMISTGTGQGGLEALFHRRYYPEDVHQVFLYNTPLCKGAPDRCVTRQQVRLGKPAKLFGGGGIKLGANGGGFSFFPNSGELNYDIKDFQHYCLRHQDSLLLLFEAYSKERHLTFRRVGFPLRALQLTVLEYRPAFFYKTISKELIPYKDYDDIRFYFEHLVSVVDPAVFSDSYVIDREPISWLALNETGGYRYYIRPFRKLLPKDIEDRSYLYAPEVRVDTVEFNRKQMKEMVRWVQREAKNIVFIYGLLDVYSAAKINLKRNASCTLLVSPVQGADCRIEAFDWGTKNYLKDLIVSEYRDFRQCE